MMRGMNVNLVKWAISPSHRLFRSPGDRGRAVEDADNCGALRAAEFDGTSKNVVGSDSALTIGRSRQRNLHWVAGNEILDLNGVADRINIGIASLQKIIDANAAARPH